MNKDSWLPFASFLSPKMKVIIPDVAGFGATVKDIQGDYRAEKQAERLAMFLEALHLKSAHIGGSSMGGCIAAVRLYILSILYIIFIIYSIYNI